ncbi:MAG: metal-dependent transcriptional regulator [Candidatus Dormibacteria bacterium]
MPKLNSSVRLTSHAQEDYLKTLLELAGASGRVPTSKLAERLRVSPASVSEMLTKLADKGLVAHDPYRGANLTTSGSAIAVEMVRHHRLIETYLVEALGYSWDEVHEEADRLEHVISEKLEHRMWEALGRPGQDPHGDPIPTPEGMLQPGPDQALSEVPGDSGVTVSRISDRDPEKLRAIDRLGLRPGSRLQVVEASQWEGPVEVEAHAPGHADQSRRISVPLGLARVIFVERSDG